MSQFAERWEVRGYERRRDRTSQKNVWGNGELELEED